MKCIFYFALILSNFSTLVASSVDIEVFNVGQGNCVLVTVNDDTPRYLLVDAGSASYLEEATVKHKHTSSHTAHC